MQQILKTIGLYVFAILNVLVPVVVCTLLAFKYSTTPISQVPFTDVMACTVMMLIIFEKKSK